MTERPVGFGPPASQPESDAAQPPPGDEVLSIVRAAARRLVENLQQGEKLTAGWSDERLADALVDRALSACLHRLAETNLWGDANRLPSGELWKIAGPLLEVGVLQHCARFKPRGYAGDFEMLARICEGYRCGHPLGRAFDEFFQSQAAPRAVATRTEQTAAALVADCLGRDTSPYHVVSVGAGPALDVHQALALLPEERRSLVRVTLLDLDPEALDFARSKIEPLLPGATVGLPSGAENTVAQANRGTRAPLACIRANVFRLPEKRDPGVALPRADFLVCSGLFDYLEEGPAAAMLRWFWDRLAPGGSLLVGNFAPHNPTRAYMEWIGNWYLIYRTAGEMRKLAEQAGIPAGQVSIGCERLGVDLFLTARKPYRKDGS